MKAITRIRLMQAVLLRMTMAIAMLLLAVLPVPSVLPVRAAIGSF